MYASGAIILSPARTNSLVSVRWNVRFAVAYFMYYPKGNGGELPHPLAGYADEVPSSSP